MQMDGSFIIANCIGNASARARRGANGAALTAELCSDLAMQCGGVPGLRTSFPVVAFTMLQERCRARGKSISVVD